MVLRSMHRQTCLVTDMWPFKKKCKHETREIIGKFYFRKEYMNETVLHGIVVSQCSNCGKVRFDDFYTENFFGLNKENQVRYAILSLKCAGFLPKVDFQMQHLDLKIPYLG